MYQIKIQENEAGQRMDKFLHKFLPLAPTSFLYKMLRKKNITLNGRKAEGKEKLMLGDLLSFYLSEETIAGFQKSLQEEYDRAYQELKGIFVVYEDAHLLVMNKPAGILSQKAAKEDLSLNEWMIGYLLAQKKLKEEQLATFKPSVCNRLDRNTMGLVMGAKTLAGSQKISELISRRQVKKFYRMMVKGKVDKEETLEGYLVKEEKNNQVHLAQKEDENASYIQTRYYPLKHFTDKTLVEAELITGKTHQLRLHLASCGHPILGDYKYGDRTWNERYRKKYGINSQLLYACRLEMPRLDAPFESLSLQRIEAPVPEIFQALSKRNLAESR